MGVLRPSLKIRQFSYVGTGAIQEVTGADHTPHVAIIKGGANIAVIKTRTMRGDQTAFFAGNTANFANGIIGWGQTGFYVGTDAKVNANGTTYYVTTIWGSMAQDILRLINYLGSGADNRNLNNAGIYGTPDFAFTKSNSAQNPSLRSYPQSGDLSWHTSGTADAADEIQAFADGLLNLGTSGRVNTSNVEYHGFTLKRVPGVIDFMDFTGDGTDNRSLPALDFDPDFALIKNGTTTNSGMIRTSSFADDSSASLGSAGPGADGIQRFLPGGIVQIGTNVSVNGNGNAMHGWFMKAGDFYIPRNRTLL